MGWLTKLVDAFNEKDRALSEGEMRHAVARTDTPEGRRRFLDLMTAHPELINKTDKNQKSALYHAAAAGDTDTMSQLIKAGIAPDFYHDALHATAGLELPEAFQLLLAAGAVVDQSHLSVTEDMAYFYTETGPEGERSRTEELGQRYFESLKMFKAVHQQQEEKRAADAETAKKPGPLVLTDKIKVRGPLRLKPSARAEFFGSWSVPG